jgi:hypothetical protein
MKIEIGNRVTAEQIKALYINQDAIKEPPYKVYRMDNKGRRWYYRTDGAEPVFFLSVTTLVRSTLPTSPFLIDWMIEKGREEARKYVELRAHYGSLMHVTNTELTINGTIDLNTFKQRVEDWRVKNKIEAEDTIGWEDRLKMDVLAWAQFMVDTEFELIAAEIILTHEDGYGGALDIVGRMNIEESGFFGEHYKSGAKAGEPKASKRTRKTTAIIDMKSSIKGYFYQEHEIQLLAYKNLWEHNYPDIPIEKTFNWSPGDWLTTPGYKLKDQTEAPNLYKWPYLLGIAREMRARKDATILQTGGILTPKTIDDCYSIKDFVQVVKEKSAEIDKTPGAAIPEDGAESDGDELDGLF